MTIFINIAAYRDPECLPTIHDLYAKATNPDDIITYLVMQATPEDNTLFFHKNVRILCMPAGDTKGVGWTRALGYRFLDKEDYVLQIDSHMRFANGWDTLLYDQLNRCGSSKPLLTTYPPAYTPPDNCLDDQPTFLSALRVAPTGHIVQRAFVINPRPTVPRPSAFVAAGFIFGRADWVREVAYDPHLYFYGEESVLAARLWTHGWDMFGPTEAIIWHYYNRAGAHLPWQDDPQWYGRDRLSTVRMRHLLGIENAGGDDQSPMTEDGAAALIDIDRYGFGTVRSFADYQKYAGVDYRSGIIAQHALDGIFGR